MAHVIKLTKEVEDIDIVTDDEVVTFRIKTDDESITRMLNLVGNAMDRFASLQHKIDTVESEEDGAEAEQAMVRLLKRCIIAIVGEDGYNIILVLMSDDGNPVDPAKNLSNIGEVFATLVTWLYDRCTSKQLREAGVYFEKQTSSMPKRKKKKSKKR